MVHRNRPHRSTLSGARSGARGGCQRHVRAGRPHGVAYASPGADSDCRVRSRPGAAVGGTDRGDSAGRRDLVLTRREALAWRLAHDRHDAHRDSGAAQRQSRGVDGKGQRRTIPGGSEHTMKRAVLYGPRDIRFEEREAPRIIEPTDAILRLSATCICGSDLWPYRGISPVAEPTPMGHEYCGIVEEVGNAVKSIRPGQFVIGSFATSDNTCPHCRYGYQASCVHRGFMSWAQAPALPVPHADGTL